MTDGPKRKWASRLSARFAVVLALALLPIGVVAFIQTQTLEKEVRARAGSALLGATLRAAASETSIIRHAQGLVAGLAQSIPDVAGDPAACSAMLKRAAALEPTAAVVAFVPVEGVMTCSSTGQVHDFSDNPVARTINSKREPFFIVNPRGTFSQMSVLAVSHPVFDPQARYLGYVAVSLPHETLQELSLDPSATGLGETKPIIFWSFDRDGKILTSSVDLEDAAKLLPRDTALKQFLGSEGEVFDSVATDGTRLTYAVVPIVPYELYLMSSWRGGGVVELSGFRSAPYLPTALMWLAGLIVSAYAAERLVTRNIRILNKSMVSFARGDRRLQAIDIKAAPIEIQELADAYLAMTESITRSEAELEDTVHQKEVLLREVHHRVKNNLQLISSIMNIQHRSARSAEAREIVKNLQERIMSLATVHRGLYQTSGLADVKARELIPDIVRQIMSLSSGPEKPFEIRLEIDDIRLVPDQAVPLSLLLTEAMTNAIKHAGATRSRPGQLLVRLKRSGGNDIVLDVVNSLPDPLPPPAAEAGGRELRLGTQLISAFVQQLGGQQEISTENGEYSFRVTFGSRPLSHAENRQVEDAEAAERWNASAT